MSTPDFNLLVTLDVLLAEGNVAKAASRLRLSPSAMSRALARLRDVTGDPLLVRAGRGLVPTPRAVELRERVAELVQSAQEVLRPTEKPDLAQVQRTFTLRVSDGFVENFGTKLLERIEREAPGIRLSFVQKWNKDSAHLRTGAADLETGVVGTSASPELVTQSLFSDRFIGVVRDGHQLLRGKLTLTRYVEGRHVSVSRRGSNKGPIDDALSELGVARNTTVIVSGFSTALALVRSSDLVATVPEKHTENLRDGLRSFELPFAFPAITVSMLWHPRWHADPVHGWFRSCLREVCSPAA
jgi:DNA-binding transcriptional LysR family regulator